jgi:arylsulfatase A-like enzyme
MITVAASAAEEAAAKRPNIVFIISDDHRWDCIGVLNPQVKTPHLDQLCNSGAYFPQATILTPQCSPSRATLLTGRPPHETGWYSNQTQLRAVHAPDGFKNFETVPGLLQKNGYRTVMVGKWHQTFEPWLTGFSDVRTWLPAGAGPYKDTPLAHGNSRERKPTSGYLQDVLGKDAAEFIGSPAAKEKPFFMWVALSATLTPLQPNQPYLEEQYAGKNNDVLKPAGFARGSAEEQLTSFTVFPGRQARRAAAAPAEDGQETTGGRAGRRGAETDWHHYYAAISSADEQLGRIQDALTSSGLAQNTIIVFLGDNGLMRGSRGWGGKVLPYEESVRVPLVISAPGQSLHGKSELPVSSLDLPASFLRWANVDPPKDWTGRPLQPVLTAKQAPEGFDHAICEYADNVSAKFGAVEYRLIRTPELKLIRWRDTAKGVNGEELFDLKSDPRELHNVVTQPTYAERLKGLRAKLEEWQQRTKDKGQAAAAELVKGEGED